MSRLLGWAGYTVGSLTLIDSVAPTQDRCSMRDYTHVQVLQQWLEIFEMLAKQTLGFHAAAIARLSLDEQLIRIHQRLCSLGVMSKKSSPDSLRGPLHTFASALRSPFTADFTLHGDVRLVTVADTKLDSAAKREANKEMVEEWRDWVPALKVFHVPGNHMTLLKEPHVKRLAFIIREARESADIVTAHSRS